MSRRGSEYDSEIDHNSKVSSVRLKLSSQSTNSSNSLSSRNIVRLLSYSVRDRLFYLYNRTDRRSCGCTDQTPPRQEFAKTDAKLKGKSLMDLQLTPSSVFYIKFSDESLNRSSSLTFLPFFSKLTNFYHRFLDPTSHPSPPRRSRRFPPPTAFRSNLRRCSNDDEESRQDSEYDG